MTYVCAECGAEKTERIPPLGHDYGEWAKLDDTRHSRICAHDPTHVETDEHHWDEGTIVSEATEQAADVVSYVCQDCGATKTEQYLKFDNSAPQYFISAYNGVDGGMPVQLSVQYSSPPAGDVTYQRNYP